MINNPIRERSNLTHTHTQTYDLFHVRLINFFPDVLIDYA